MGYTSKSVGSVETYSADDLNAMTVAQIKALAAELGYSIKKTLKADIIAEFLEQQNGPVE
jgi:hypothetical protein